MTKFAFANTYPSFRERVGPLSPTESNLQDNLSLRDGDLCDLGLGNVTARSPEPHDTDSESFLGGERRSCRAGAPVPESPRLGQRTGYDPRRSDRQRDSGQQSARAVITLATYEQAGGAVRRDPFTDGDDGSSSIRSCSTGLSRRSSKSTGFAIERLIVNPRRFWRFRPG